MNPVKKPWYSQLKDQANLLDLTLEEIGDYMGVTASAVGHWFNGRREIGASDLFRLVEFLQMKWSDLDPDENVVIVSDDDTKAWIEIFSSKTEEERAALLSALGQKDPPKTD